MWKKIVLSVVVLVAVAGFSINKELMAGHCHGGYGGGYYPGNFGGGYHPGYYGGYRGGYHGGYAPYPYYGGFNRSFYPRGNTFYYGSRNFGIGVYSR